MATKSQRKDRKAKRKQQQKKRAKVRRRKGPFNAIQANVRHRQRMEMQVPEAWQDEAIEDVALFDDSALESLSPELAEEVRAIQQALALVCQSKGDETKGEEAVAAVAGIQRSSPLSEWRLFVRGVVAWMSGDTESASRIWKRLDRARRPGRIAVSMMMALETELDSITNKELLTSASDREDFEWRGQLDGRLLYHAKLLRRSRISRAAIRNAKVGVAIVEELDELTIGPRLLLWLTKFALEFRDTEPDLVAALEAGALHRAFNQSFTDVFERAASTLRGPRHDRKNKLLSCFYWEQFSEDRFVFKRSEDFLEEYVKNDLPNNEELTVDLRNAIISTIHLNEAESMIAPAETGMVSMFYRHGEDTEAIRRRFSESVKAYPGNRAAHRAAVDWWEGKLSVSYLTKSERKPLEKQLAAVMTRWSKSLPEDVEPRLWLVDYLLENEETKKAEPHVKWLSGARHDDPRVRATPWKWQLLEAMRLCRRKAWMDEALVRLDDAESIWPNWISADWLPYLRASWHLRRGEMDRFEQLRDQICESTGRGRDSLPVACMMLGAAQRMRVSASELKLFRAPVEAALKQIGEIPLDELLDVCAFFWDLDRTKLLYPAYRMHGSKFVKEVCSRFEKGPGLVSNHLDDRRVQAAVLLASNWRFWSQQYTVSLPSWYSLPAVREHTMFIAAHANSIVCNQLNFRIDGFDEIAKKMHAAAVNERDVYYRHWFEGLAIELEKIVAKRKPRVSASFGGQFSNFGRSFDPIDDDDDECDCPECRAERDANDDWL